MEGERRKAEMEEWKEKEKGDLRACCIVLYGNLKGVILCVIKSYILRTLYTEMQM